MCAVESEKVPGFFKLEQKDWVTEVPRFPDYPKSEWDRRITRAKKLMEEQGIDALVVFKREDVRYFFGFQTTHWEIPSIQPAVGIIPREGEPALMVPDLLLYNAQVFTWTRNIFVQPRAHEVPKERAVPLEIAKRLKEMGLEKGTIALESGRLGCMWIPRPYSDIQAFVGAMPEAKFVDGDKIIWGCRMIKSALEVDRIRQAAAVIAQMHAAVVDGYRPGMTEMDLGKLIHHVEVDSGDFRGGDTAVCDHIICNSDKEGVADCLALDGVTITKGDYIQVDLQHKHKGYWADIARTFQIGPVDAAIQRNYDLCLRGLETGVKMIRPGVPINEVYKEAVRPVIEAGLPVFEMAGHGIGMDIHEPPSVDATNDMLMEEGMVFSLEVWVWGSFRRHGGEGMYGLEDQYVVTKDGYERIEGLPKNIIQVAHPLW